MASVAELEKALKNPNVKKLLDVIATAEGADYGTLFGGKTTSDFSKHPNVSTKFTETTGNQNVTTAAGRYQFLKGTWDGVAKKYGLKDFSPRNQDLAAVALIKSRGALGDVLKGDLTGAIGKLGNEWASLPSSTAPQPKKSWAEIEKMVGSGGKMPNRASSKAEIDALLKAYDQSKAKTDQSINPKAKGVSVDQLLKAYDDKKESQLSEEARNLRNLDYAEPTAPVEKTSPTIGQEIKGGLETLATLGTGATTGAIGQVAGTFKGVAQELINGEFGTPQAAQRIAQSAAQGAEVGTYAPRTETGQRNVQAVGEILEPVGAIAPALAPELGALRNIGKAAGDIAPAAIQKASPAVQQATQKVTQPIANVAQSVKSGVSSVAQKVTGSEQQSMSGIGAADVLPAEQRQKLFEQFDVSPTEAQVSRDTTQLAELYNTARKGGEPGKIVQSKLDEQQSQLEAKLNDIIEAKDARSIDAEDIGANIKGALGTQFKVEQVKQRKAYESVRNSEGAKGKVDLSTTPKYSDDYLAKKSEEGISPETRNILEFINEESSVGSSKVYDVMKNDAIRLGIADKDSNGNLVPKPKGQEPNINQIEEWRKRAGSTGSKSDAGDIRAQTQIKSMIDNYLDNSGSNLFKNARKKFAEFKDEWSNKAIITDLIQLKKGGSTDPKVIDERVIERITRPTTSQKDLEFVKTMIEKSEGGKQAWNDLQASIIDHIKSEAYSGAADTSGNPTLVFNRMDKAIKKLDGKTQRLDTLLGKAEADKMRDASELARIIQTVPPNTGVNWSNTATALAATIDGIIFGSTGMPAPLATSLRLAMKYIKDKKDVARAQHIVRKFEKESTSKGKF